MKRHPSNLSPLLHSDPAVVGRLEATEAERGAALVAALRELGYAPEGRADRIGGGWALFAGRKYPMNRAAGLGMEGPVGEEELDALEHFYDARRVTPSLELCPLADPSLMEGAARRSFRIQRFFNVLARPLSPADAEGESGASPSLRVEPVGESDRDRWVRTATGHADWQERARTDWQVALAAAAAQRPGVTCFRAYLDEEPAGVGSLSMVGGVAGLFHAFTRPEHRGQGVQSELIRARIAWAAAHGCDLVTTTTSPPGNASQRNLERAGFQVLYTRPVLVRDQGSGIRGRR